jgi:hypothetical protein
MTYSVTVQYEKRVVTLPPAEDVGVRSPSSIEFKGTITADSAEAALAEGLATLPAPVGFSLRYVHLWVQAFGK